MFRFHREIVGIAAAVAVGLIGAAGCTSDIEEEPSGSGGSGTGGSSGSGTGGGTTSAECQPTAAICYGNRELSTNPPGSECMATIDNSTSDHVQMRQTWTRVVAPVGNTTDTVYSVLKSRAQLKLDACYMSGDGGYIQLTDWDRSNPIKTEQTVRSGYASYSRQPPSSTAPTPETLMTEGLCMVAWDYTFTSPVAIPAVPDAQLVRWQDPATPVARQTMAQPWHIAPVTAKRVETEAEIDVATLRETLQPGEGRVYIDEANGYLHSYAPLAYVTVLDNRSGGLAVPIREAEIRTKFNDSTFNCVGRFRADVMTTALSCDSATDQTNPPWGCALDSACPPPGIAGLTEGAVKAATVTEGASPSYTKGYFLIIDLERVWASTLSATLCVTYPGEQTSVADGWSNPTGWGKNCRGSPKWDPTLPDDAGLPMGDWCSKTNSAATATCHDAYLSESFSTGQAFKVKPDTCPLQ